MQSQTLLHKLYLPQKHEYIRIIRRTCMHAVAYSATQADRTTLACMHCLGCHISMHTVALCAIYACIPLHNVSCRLACTCMICHVGTHVVTQCTTQARMQWQNPPHIHASIGTSFTRPIRYSGDGRAREPQNEPRTVCGDTCLFNILMNHLVQPATRWRSSKLNCPSKAQNGKWRFLPHPPYRVGSMRASIAWSARPHQVQDCPNPCREHRGRSQEGPEHRCRMGYVNSWVALAGHACTSQLVI